MRTDFPMLNLKMNGKRIAYLDNAATSLKPICVSEAMQAYLLHHTSNVHRGVYRISEENTSHIEAVRSTCQSFINAIYPHEIIFTSGTTHSINLLAFSLGEMLKENDEIVISALEHHANIVPWQMLCERKNLKLKVIPLNADGTIDQEAALNLLNTNVKILSLSLASNTTGILTPAEILFKKAKEYNIITIADAAQAVAHMKIDVQELQCDFLVFSGHKILGPTGAGVLYGKEALLEKMPPYQGGGNMIDQVSFEQTTYNQLPHKFEPGTPAIAEIIGLGSAIEYFQKLGLKKIHELEFELFLKLKKDLSEITEVSVYGPSKNRLPIFAFNMKGVHPHDLGQILDQEGVCIRTGHHCTQPLMKHFGVTHMGRASLSFYNIDEDIHQFIQALKKARQLLLGK